MVEPRMLMVSRLMVSRVWPAGALGVILTARRAVFICGETDMIVPWMIVPEKRIRLCQTYKSPKLDIGGIR